jgi:hypothetical protein
MRVAVFFALILMVATPSRASVSCMTMTEARQHFGLVHIYWHGADHCWDASPGRRQQHGITQRVAAKPDQQKWRDAMSEMVPDARVASETAPDAQLAQIRWLDRWVEMKPSEPPPIARRVDDPQAASPAAAEPTKTPFSDKSKFENYKLEGTSLPLLLTFAFLVIALPFVIIVAVPQGMIYRRQSE